MNSQKQSADLRGERHGCCDSEAEGEDLQDGRADACHEDDGEEFVAEFGAGGEVDGPVASTHGTRKILGSCLRREGRCGKECSRIEIRNLYYNHHTEVSNRTHLCYLQMQRNVPS